MRVLMSFAVGLTVLAGGLFGSSTASATTFCVPAFFDRCPDNGTNMLALGSGPAQKLESAMALDSNDGIPDTVMLDAGTYADSDSFEVEGSDDLTVIGSGRENTVLTSTSTGNRYVLDLYTGNTRKVKVKDLAVVVPESFPSGPGYGAGIQTSGDDFESVDMVTENPGGIGSSGFTNITDGGSFRDIRVFGRNGARFATAFGSITCGNGPLSLVQADLADSNYGVSFTCPTMPVSVDLARFRGVNWPLSASNGSYISASNVLIESGDYVPVDVYNGDGNGATRIDLDHATIVATGDPSLPALRAKVADSSAATDSAEISLNNSIIVGFQETWNLEAPASPARGDVSLTARYSRFDQANTEIGDVTSDSSVGNTSESPGFVGITDYRLSPGSVAIDAGDPDALEPTEDLEGGLRPVDGDRDGLPVRDMGAYEFVPDPLECPADPSLCPPGAKKPKLSKLKFSYRAGKGGKLKFRLSTKAKVLADFRPVPKKAKGKKRKRLKLSRQAKAGANTFELGGRALSPGRYRLVVRATGENGQKSKLLIRKIKVKAPRSR